MPPGSCTSRCATFLDYSGDEELGQGKERVAVKRSYSPEQIVRLMQDVQARLVAWAFGVDGGVVSGVRV